MSNCVNNYVLEYFPKDLLWYERDGLMTWYDQVKCENFLRDTGKHFKEAKIINFNIIHQEARGEKVPEEVLKHYQTLQDHRVRQYSEPDQRKILSSAFRTDTKDLFFKRKTVLNHFKKEILFQCI